MPKSAIAKTNKNTKDHFRIDRVSLKRIGWTSRRSYTYYQRLYVHVRIFSANSSNITMYKNQAEDNVNNV